MVSCWGGWYKIWYVKRIQLVYKTSLSSVLHKDINLFYTKQDSTLFILYPVNPLYPCTICTINYIIMWHNNVYTKARLKQLTYTDSTLMCSHTFLRPHCRFPKFIYISNDKRLEKRNLCSKFEVKKFLLW